MASESFPPTAPRGPYPVSDVDGRAVVAIDDFVGVTDFRISIDGEPIRVDGYGVRDGVGVRFVQITTISAPQRIWRICAVAGAGFLAECQRVRRPSGTELPTQRSASRSDLIDRFVVALAALDDDPTDHRLLTQRLAKACVAVLPIIAAAVTVFDEAALAGISSRVVSAGRTSDGREVRNRAEFHESTADGRYRRCAMVPLRTRSAELGVLALYYNPSRELMPLEPVDLVPLADHITATLVGSHSRVRQVGDRTLDGAPGRSQLALAIGMLAEGLHISRDDALAVLRASAYVSGRAVDQIAIDLVDNRLPLEQLQPSSN